MKMTKITLLAILGLSIGLASCKKEGCTDPTAVNYDEKAKKDDNSCIYEDDQDNEEETQNPSAQDLKNYFQDNEASAVQTFTLDADNPTTITGSQGTSIDFYSSSFETSSGQIVTGNVEIEFIEIFSKEDMIRLNKPTVGMQYNGNYGTLISGGEFKVTATQNGETLSLRPGYSMQLTVPAPNGVDPEMEIFYGSIDDDTLTWNPSDSSLIWGQNNQYNAYFDSLNWINCDYFMNSGGQLTTVQVEVPAGFNNNNCALFVSFDGMNSITNFYNFSNSVFSTGASYQIPVGTDVHFIALSFINGNPHVAIVPAEIQNNHYETITSLTQTTSTQFQNDLSNLP